MQISRATIWSHRMRVSARIALVTSIALLAACGMQLRAGSDFDSGLDLSLYDTFDWAEPDDRPIGDARLENNPFFTDRLHAAITRELAGRGIRHSTEAPRLLVHHHALVRDRVHVVEADRDAGYMNPEAAGTQVIQYEEGTFLVDLADAETRQILWRGWAVADVEGALGNPQRMQELLDKAVAEMFKEYPAR